MDMGKIIAMGSKESALQYFQLFKNKSIKNEVCKYIF